MNAPLADRMRPRILEEFVGQGHILAPGRLLWRAIQADQLSSLIFYGPPGTGKTTLARIIANTTEAHFIALNAVLSGVKDIREAIATATKIRQSAQRRTILFIDEVHRFNKSQQDALLPWVENGTVVLIGATTENPYSEVNKALVSRSRLFQLKPLTVEDLRQVARQALTDSDRGYGALLTELEPEALEHWVNTANGDARALLNAVELALETTLTDRKGVIHLTLEVAEESIQQRAVLYDKEGDIHFDTISAFIKSVRGSDPDAALYWLARMIYAGEDPRFIFRRLLILASEDVGLADPNAVVVVNACAEAFDRVGMPEGRYPLAQATLYLATTAKSNSVMGFFDALAAVEQEQQADIPNPLKDANRDKQGFGHGAGYLYPHAYRDHWVAQQYLPQSLQGRVFYQPSDQGMEAEIQQQVARQREAQLAAVVETSMATSLTTSLEVLTYSKPDRRVEHWLQRTLGQAGERLAQIREQIFNRAQLQRHHRVLDLNGDSGLLTWEAVRQCPEGGVYTCAWTKTAAETLGQQAMNLPELQRPVVLPTQLERLPEALSAYPGLEFDCILGRNAVVRASDKVSLLNRLKPFLAQSGRIALAESIPRHTQRLYNLLHPNWLQTDLYHRLVAAETKIYQTLSDPLVNWDAADLQTILEQLGLTVELTVETYTTQMVVTPSLLNRWFPKADSSGISYASRLAEQFTTAELADIQISFQQNLLNQTVNWKSKIAILAARFATKYR